MHKSGGDRAHRRAAVSLDAVTDDIQRGKFLDQRPGELGTLPVAVDDWQHLVVDEVAGAPQVVQLSTGQLVRDPEIVGTKRAADVLVHGVPRQVSKTYVPGASMSDRSPLPPGSAGAGFSAPQRSPSHASMSGHQLPWPACAVFSQSAGFAGLSLLTW